MGGMIGHPTPRDGALSRTRPLCLRATAAPDPDLRSALPLAAFVPIPVPSDPATLDALCDAGQWTEVLERARGADPMLAAERPALCAAITCWQSLGQIGEASRLIRTLEPLRSGHLLSAARYVAPWRSTHHSDILRDVAFPWV